jgi:MoaA/NifB/PqqE/SkfB family radical SAM enzyme
MELDTVKDWLKSLVDTQPIESVTIHGGEPFLYLDLLAAIIEYVKDLNIERRWVITNGYWAVREEESKKLLSKLKKSGLRCITFSVDAFHQEHIPFDCVHRGIDSAVAVGFDTIAVDSYFLSKRRDNEYDKTTMHYKEELKDSHGVVFSSYNADFEGRAADQLVQYATLREEIPNRPCKLPFWIGGDLKNPETVEIDHEGNVTLCPGLCIGNARNVSLMQIIQDYDYRNHAVIRIIAEKGPGALFSLLKSGSYNDFLFFNECHACYVARKALIDRYPSDLRPVGCYIEE